MISLDRKYLLLISSRLERFKQKKTDLFMFRCPLCGDSQKNKLKSRGFIYSKDDNYYFKCHNCNRALVFKEFLRELDNSYYNQYLLERLSNKTIYVKPIQVEAQVSIPKFRKHINLPTIESLPEDHPAKTYITGRMIPQVYHSVLFYAEDFKAFTDEIWPDHEKEMYSNDQRIVIPFYDEDGKLLGYQGRSVPEINPSYMRYITIKLIENNLKLFGMDRVDPSKKMYVFEGPIDSFFIKNSIATCDASLLISAKYYTKNNLVLVFDKDISNKDVTKQIKRAITENFNVCLLPKNPPGKDINEIVMKGFNGDLKKLVDDHTFNGLRASLEFSKWKLNG